MTDLVVKGHGSPRLVTEIPGPKSRALLERRTAAVARGVGIMLPVFVAKASGALLTDVDGNTLIDFGAGIAVVSVGHADPRVVQRVSEQVARFTHTCFMITPYEGYLEVCEALARLTPGTHEKRSALFNSGAEAVENAVKIARAATGRQAVVAVEHGYHGRTNLTMAMTAKSMPYKRSFGPFAPEVYRAPTSYPYRDGLSGADAVARVIAVIDKQVGAKDVACLVIEPIQGEGGFIVPAHEFLPRLAEYCTEHGIVFVADEIQTGFGRTGAMFACEHDGVVPDLICTAKALAGGLPLAAVTGRAALMDAPHVGGLGGTFGGNPVSCAAALGAIETIEALDLAGRAAAIGKRLLSRLGTLANRHAVVGDVRGRGAMFAVEFSDPQTGRPDAATTAAVAGACHRQGLVVLTCGTDSNVIRLLPPLVIDDDLLDEGLTILERAIASVVAD